MVSFVTAALHMRRIPAAHTFGRRSESHVIDELNALVVWVLLATMAAAHESQERDKAATLRGTRVHCFEPVRAPSRARLVGALT